MLYASRPCDECPWRRDVKPGQFPADRFRALAPCAYDMAPQVFACHKSTAGKEFACAGFLLSQGAHNLSIRLARHRFDVTSPVPLFKNYRQMAVANGVDPADPVLDSCRDDGQM